MNIYRIEHATPHFHQEYLHTEKSLSKLQQQYPSAKLIKIEAEECGCKPCLIEQNLIDEDR